MNKRWKRARTVAAMMTAAMLAAGCGGSDKSTNPGTHTTTTAFDQSTAASQAALAAPQAAALAQSITSLAGGFGAPSLPGVRPAAGGTYGWNDQTMQWEYHYVDDVAGYNYDWNYTVQYVDSAGTPQEYPVHASLLQHSMHGTLAYASNQAGYNFTYNYTYDYNVTVNGLGTSLYAMLGSGGYNLDFTYVGSGINQHASYVVQWDALGNGVTVAPGGCPSGTIRYTFPPYYMDVVFDGTGSTAYTLYNSGGGKVSSGSGTYPLICGH